MKRMSAAFAISLGLALTGCVRCPPSIFASAVQLPCCPGESDIQRVSINTGTAPWRVIPPSSTTFHAVQVLPAGTAWTTLPPADWITLAGEPQGQGDYIYELQVYVPPCPGGGDIQVVGEFAADNRAVIYVDGGTTPIAVSQGQPNFGYLAAGVTPFAAAIAHNAIGTHTLRAVVTDVGLVTGLIMHGEVVRRCRPLR